MVGVPCVADAALRIDNHSRGYAAGNAQTAPSVRSQMTPGNSNAVMGTVAAVPADTVQNTAPAQTNNIATVPANENSLSATASHECPLIYPNGEIMWGTPTIGAGIGGADTCVAVVELVGYQAAKDGSNLVLARANMALGDTIKCNISSFPEATMYANAVESFYFPSDNPPSMDDVVAQMNREQKQNAGLKIAAGAVIGGLGGNMAGDGNGDSLLGTDKGKIQGTVIGALSGAALMAGNAYAGKVAGDVILSTGVNAAAGGVVGNMVQTGDSVLRIEDCVIPDQDAENGERKTTCLWGALATTDNGLGSGETAYYRIDDTSGATYVCSGTGDDTTCDQERLVNIRLAAYPNTDITQIKEEQFEKDNIFGLGKSNDTYSQYFSGKSYLIGICNINRQVFEEKYGKMADEEFRKKIATQEFNNDLMEQINQVSKDQKLLGYQKIKKVFCVDDHWTIENGFLSPTFKLKRKAITNKYKDLIEKAYA